uniref:Protein quiver n=1 Tax=Octopus bimaculoides TaxID=37653 RepID=A0A0L8HHX2_OCTBM
MCVCIPCTVYAYLLCVEMNFVKVFENHKNCVIEIKFNSGQYSRLSTSPKISELVPLVEGIITTYNISFHSSSYLGVVGTHRFCSSRDMGEQCQDIWYADHERMYRSCVFTCSGDACNATERLSTKWYHISAGMILSLACILFTSNLH